MLPLDQVPQLSGFVTPLSALVYSSLPAICATKPLHSNLGLPRHERLSSTRLLILLAQGTPLVNVRSRLADPSTPWECLRRAGLPFWTSFMTLHRPVPTERTATSGFRRERGYGSVLPRRRSRREYVCVGMCLQSRAGHCQRTSNPLQCWRIPGREGRLWKSPSSKRLAFRRSTTPAK